MKIKIIYETQTGTTKYVAEIIKQRLDKLGHKTDLHSVMTDGYRPIIDNYDMLLFGAPTYDDGQLEFNMNQFISQFSPNLSKLKVAVFGLGDSGFSEFCTSAEILENWVKKNFGKLLIASLKIDGYPQDLNLIDDWIKQLSDKMSR